MCWRKKPLQVWHRAFLMNKGLAFCVNVIYHQKTWGASEINSNLFKILRCCWVVSAQKLPNLPTKLPSFISQSHDLARDECLGNAGFTQVWTNSQAGFCTAHFIFSFVKLQKSCVAIIVILCLGLKFIDAMLLFLKKAGMFFRFCLSFDCIRGVTNFDVSEQEMSHLIRWSHSEMASNTDPWW